MLLSYMPIRLIACACIDDRNLRKEEGAEKQRVEEDRDGGTGRGGHGFCPVCM